MQQHASRATRAGAQSAAPGPASAGAPGLHGLSYAAQADRLRPPPPVAIADVPDLDPARVATAEAGNTAPSGAANVEAGADAALESASAGAETARPIALPGRAAAEAAFGADFSGVQAQFDPSVAAEGAEAVTEGDTIRFADEAPDREVVFHELAHVVQQRQHGAGPASESQPADAAEHEADHAAKAATAGRRATVKRRPSARRMRKAAGRFAATDRFNKAAVTSNTGVGNKRRPGVKAAGHINFDITVDAPVYAGDLTTKLGTLKKGDYVRCNPSTSRKKGGTRYILVWNRNHGAAWIDRAAVAHGQAIVSALKGFAGWQPARGGTKGPLKHFRTAEEYHPPGAGYGEYILPYQKSTANKVDHHGLRTGWKEDTYNVFLNLPQSDAAAVARDIAVQGDSFRIMGKRAVPTYVARSGTPTKGVVFYFGYVNGDSARRGWVMANCVK